MTAREEAAELECKVTLDLDEARDRLHLVQEVAAMANSGGGRILVGVDDDGHDVGIPAALADKLDPATVGDLVDTFLNPDRLEVGVERRTLAGGGFIVEIVVPAVPDPPVVMARVGNYTDDRKRQRTLFPQHAVYVRRTTRAEPARRADFQRWRRDAVDNTRREILERLAMVVEAPPDSEVRIVAEAEVHDSPSFLLSRSADLFRQGRDRLLSTHDLTYLWRHRGTLVADATARELLIQSALRKRATLYFWLGYLRPEPPEVRNYLYRAPTMSDRDKSDAGTSILLTAALYLDDADYQQLLEILHNSRYRHFRDAAEKYPTPEAAGAAIRDQLAGTFAGVPLTSYTADDLLRIADDLVSGEETGAARQLTQLGLAYLWRHQPELAPWPTGPGDVDR